jgi:hypothetical protein
MLSVDRHHHHHLLVQFAPHHSAGVLVGAACGATDSGVQSIPIPPPPQPAPVVSECWQQ